MMASFRTLGVLPFLRSDNGRMAEAALPVAADLAALTRPVCYNRNSPLTSIEDIMFTKRLISIALFAGCCLTVVADDQPPQNQAPREERLAAYLNGVKFVGKFTIDGRDDDAKTEAYTISKCEKLPEQDMYQITARITYGEVDSELPLKIKILWSGNTPVITLDNFWIPAMGTFGARVLIHSDRYAGTWQHDAVGGHMFGRIEKIEPSKPESDSEPAE